MDERRSGWPCAEDMQRCPSPECRIAPHREGKVVVYADSTLVPPQGVRELIRLPEVLRGLPGRSSRSAARTTLWRWNPCWRVGRPLVVRQFVHGGLLGHLWGTLFLSSRPMLRELRVTLHGLSRAVPTCRPAALRLERVVGPVLRGHYITEEIEGAENLLEFCRRRLATAWGYSPAERQALAAAVARTIAAMHHAGIYHGDLNLKNLLVAATHGRAEVYVVDFKKARLMDRVPFRARLRNLARLDRSVVKWRESRQAVTVSDRLRVLRDYLQAEPEAAGDWKQIARRIRTSHAAHALSRR